jgi:uncharacterized protein YegJ (DUF2314 family)
MALQRLRAQDATSVEIKVMDSVSAQRDPLLHHSSKGGKKGAYWVESLTTSSLAFVGMVNVVQDTVRDTAGYGVLDQLQQQRQLALWKL